MHSPLRVLPTVAFACVYLMAMPSASNASRSWYVNTAGTGDALTIQAAIDLCVTGDSVVIGDGTYAGLGNTDLDPAGKEILVMAENGPGAVIIDCIQDVTSIRKRGFYFHSGEGASMIVDGLTFVNAVAPELDESEQFNAGGGVACVSSSPTIRNCVFTTCNAYEGAGAYCYLSSAAFINCTFVNNAALAAAGLMADSLSSITIDSCIIASNLNAEGVACKRSSSVTLKCSDVWGNDEGDGDWVDCIAGQSGLDGNISADPRFCDPASEDYHLGDLSECAPANNSCGVLMGALGVNCVWCAVDGDGDGYGDPGNPSNLCADDNCPTVYNPAQTDADGDGWGGACECDDGNILIHPNTFWHEDSDGDDYGNPSVSLQQCEQPAGYVLDNTDCDDTDDSLNPDTEWYRDADDDGYGTPADVLTQCEQPPGYVRNSDDCHDSDPTRNPETRFFEDVDGDNHGDPNVALTQCAWPTGYVRDSTDNCITVWNIGQEDADGDAIGDSCDTCTDSDGDGAGDVGYVHNTCPDDNCPATPNPEQGDADGDGIGDACDTCTDTDGDFFGDPGFPANTCPTDNCPSHFNPVQTDSDGDGHGNECDNCPNHHNPGQEDADGDNIGDVCECSCPYQGDFDEDLFLTALDLSAIIDILFAGSPDDQDPNCTVPRADLDCDGFSTALDLSGMIDHLFTGGGGPCDPCAK